MRARAAGIPKEQRTDLTRALASLGPVIFEPAAFLGSDCNHAPGVGASGAVKAAAACCGQRAPPASFAGFGLDVDLGLLTRIACELPTVSAGEAEVRESIELGCLRVNALAVAIESAGKDDDDDDAVVSSSPLCRAEAPAGSVDAATLDGTIAGKHRQLDPAAVAEQFGTRLSSPTRLCLRTGHLAAAPEGIGTDAPPPVLTKDIFIGLVRESIERQTGSTPADRELALKVVASCSRPCTSVPVWVSPLVATR